MERRTEEIDLLALLAAGWQRRRIVAAGIGIGLLVASLYNHLASHEYTVKLQVTPVTISTGSASSGRLGDLASFAGIDISGGSETSSFELYLIGINSRAAADILALDESLMKVIFPDEWDEPKQGWTQQRGILKAIGSIGKSILGIPERPWEPPSAERVHEFLKDEIRINRDGDSSVVTISIEVENPAAGGQILWALHQAVDNKVRKKTLDRTSSYISYLTGLLRQMNIAEYREAVIGLLAEQEKLVMVASSDLAFAAEPFGRPNASFEPTSPMTVIIILVGFLFGGALGLGAGAIISHRKP